MKKIPLIKVKIDGEVFYTTSVIPQRNGTYPIWNKRLKFVDFIKKEHVKIL